MIKIPAILACSILFFALGAAAGVAGLILFGQELTGLKMTVDVEKATKRRADPGKGGPEMMPNKGGPPAGMMMGGKAGKGGKGGKGGAGMMAMMMGGPSSTPKSQLESLIVKLDVLTQKPLKIELTKEQAKQVADEVHELAKGELDDDNAKKHLDSLLKTLEEQKDTLVAAGFRWPSANGEQKGGPGGGGGPPVDLPKHLKSLGQRFAGKTESKVK
jgi:hypothetical protein